MRILIIHKVHSVLTEKLRKEGFDVDVKLDLSREEVIELLPLYNGLIVRSALKVDEEILSAGTNLKFVGRLGAGMENIDAEFAKLKGIRLFNAPEGNRSAVGEQAVGMLLSLFNNLNRADSEVRKGIWLREQNRGEEIEGKTIGIIGYGNMGGAFARKISGFGARVLAYDKYKTDFGDEFAEEVQMETIFKEADIISLHVPLQDDTFHLVNNSFLDSCKYGVYIINTARGSVVKTEDLVHALMSKQVKGACLDVLEFEGMSFEDVNADINSSIFSYLTDAKNVLLSPHIAGWTHQSNIKMAEILAQKIIFSFK